MAVPALNRARTFRLAEVKPCNQPKQPVVGGQRRVLWSLATGYSTVVLPVRRGRSAGR